MADTTQLQRRLTRKEACAYLDERWGVVRAVQTLAKLASIGGGPRFEHAGRKPLYRPEELDAWVARMMSPMKSSTSDTGARAA